ncbi:MULTISPECIES: hypothetical protein [Vibrio]|uniref:hypothetical protein n=1 Tax=Vibrio TaxID=662 RepID=UPI001649D03E|nr:MULTISPECIES: hypothetical protein [Vibrio]BDR16319.1 hypothetical protein VspSTUT11_42950 [Vibrio sp. STUT-A11]HCG5272422.1 hypothetical protein [Vibrio parahaemolyticus]HCG8026314.1 hypothetical protein [Vibrio parahaemolyticus]HCH1698462.1 hypothetical protein [Vibrio parahaemolyticus]
MKIYYEQVAPDMISTFTPGEGWYTFKSMDMMHASLGSEFGEQLELIEFTPEMYESMRQSGDFDGYEPA